MLKQHETGNTTFESRMAGDEKKARCHSTVVLVMLLLLGLLVGGWFALGEWLDSGKALPAAIKGAAWAAAIVVTTATTMASSSRRSCGDCWLKKLHHRVKRRLTSTPDTPWPQR